MAEIYYEPSGCNCAGICLISHPMYMNFIYTNKGTDYAKADINTAANKALELASQGQTLVYNDYEHFTFSNAQKPYLEFPIMAGDVYNGSSPGADRVVIGSFAEDYSSAVYCAVITHDGETRNGFAECADDTLNLRGKGEYKAGGRERKLLQKINIGSD
ncbi:hypothetical protein MMC17_006036 [Xylographa soralifera]|nr:hypothetical protein [Xylographa soralifera]